MENPIIFTAEIIGTIAFASSGAMLGIRKNLDLFGVLVLGLCVAVGGGIVRDIILGRTPPGAFRDPVYALVALGTSALLFLLVYGKQEIMTSRYLTIYEQVMNYCDAVGLGIFTVLGVYTAHGEGYDGIFFLVFLGMMTGIGGGLIRDILADTMPFILYKHIYAMAAPATEGQFGDDITMASWKNAMKELGFTDFFDVGLGGDMTAAYESEEWAEAYKAGEKKVTSCCPAFVNMVRLHYPDLADCVSTTVSPMCAVSRLIKARDPEAVTVFIGPCIAKKSEVVDQQIPGNADYVLTYSEIRAIMKAKSVVLQPAANDDQIASTFGKRFANSGGVTAAVLQSLKESEDEIDAKVCVANGAAECKKALLLLKAARLPEDFIEGMACEGGCVGGPSAFNDQISSKKNRDILISQADDRGIHENIEHYEMNTISMHRE